MKRLLITSPLYTGEAEVIYDDAGRLISFSVSATNMPVAMVSGFKNTIPAVYDQLATVMADKKATIVEAGFNISFEMWWDKYDHKRNKVPAQRVWDKLTESERVTAYYNTDVYKKWCADRAWYNQLYPDTYLRQKNFNTEWNNIK